MRTISTMLFNEVLVCLVIIGHMSPKPVHGTPNQPDNPENGTFANNETDTPKSIKRSTINAKAVAMIEDIISKQYNNNATEALIVLQEYAKGQIQFKNLTFPSTIFFTTSFKKTDDILQKVVAPSICYIGAGLFFIFRFRDNKNMKFSVKLRYCLCFVLTIVYLIVGMVIHGIEETTEDVASWATITLITILGSIGSCYDWYTGKLRGWDIVFLVGSLSIVTATNTRIYLKEGLAVFAFVFIGVLVITGGPSAIYYYKRWKAKQNRGEGQEGQEGQGQGQGQGQQGQGEDEQGHEEQGQGDGEGEGEEGIPLQDIA